MEQEENGCLQIKRKVGERICVFVEGIKVEIVVSIIREKTCALVFFADRDKVTVIREELMGSLDENFSNRIRGVHRKQSDKDASRG